MTNRRKQSHYHAYLLRFWQEGGDADASQPRWRYSLEDPHTSARRSFASFEALIAFLHERLGDEARSNSSPENGDKAS